MSSTGGNNTHSYSGSEGGNNYSTSDDSSTRSPPQPDNQSIIDASPSAIAADPIAAENFNIEKSLLFVSSNAEPQLSSQGGRPGSIAEKVRQETAATATATALEEDTFDWLGDDKDLYELSKGLYTGPPMAKGLTSTATLYDNAQPSNPLSMHFPDEDAEDEEAADAAAASAAHRHRLLPRKLFHVLFLTLQMALISVSLLGHFGHYELGELAGAPLHVWSMFGLISIFVPLVAQWMLQVLVKRMRHTKAFEGGELPNFVDSLRGPIVLAIGTMASGTFWFNYLPRGCKPGTPSPVEGLIEWCLLDYAMQVFQSLLLVSVGLAVEMTIMFYATLRFHERTFKDRIIKCRFKIYIIQQMALKALEAQRDRYMNRSSVLSSAAELRFAGDDDEADFVDEEEGSYLKELGKFLKATGRRVAALWRGSRRVIGSAANYVQIQVDDQAAAVPVPLASSQSYARFSRKLKKHMQLYGYEQFARNQSGLNDHESRILARDLFHFLCPRGKDHLVLSDFLPCFATTGAAHDAFKVFDKDEDGTISKKEFRNAVVSIYADLRDLTKSIRVSGTALKKLDGILKGIVVTLVFLAVLAMFSVNVTNLLTFSLSLVIGLNFLFGDLAKHFLHSMILLFVHHPFDIGDTIVVGLFEEGVYLKDILTVKHIELMTTVFTRWNGQETYVPNHMLANAPFMANLSRSVEQWEKIDFAVPTTTPESRLTEMRHRIGEFLRSYEKDYYRVFDLHAVVAADMGNAEKDLDELKFTLRVRCKPSSDSQKRWSRHARLLKFIKVTLLEELMEVKK